MPAHAIVGAQWGDEGKGKIVDYLAPRYDWVVRFQGGNNAGHTVKVKRTTYKFHLLPSGAVQGRRIVIGNGVVVDPRVLAEEIDNLAKLGKKVRLSISDRAHVILPYHLLQDGWSEDTGIQKIGTTRRGIGPCYADKAARRGVRMGELAVPQRFRRRLHEVYPYKIRELLAVGLSNVPRLEDILAEYDPLGQRFAPYVTDTSDLLSGALEKGERVLYEGAQGVLLDLDHGTYPYVTSSSTVAGNATTGSGVPAQSLGPVMGVAKAYATRVGEGPFPTEISRMDPVGRHILEVGREFGTTTGRARRVGWLDLVALRYAIRVGGLTHLAVTKLDVLAGLEEIRACVAYERDGRRVTGFPTDAEDLAAVRPLWWMFKGWKRVALGEGKKVRLSTAAGEFLEFLETETGLPVVLASVGPSRDETLVTRPSPFVPTRAGKGSATQRASPRRT